MRALFRISFWVLAVSLMACGASEGNASKRDEKNKERCANFGFKEGTDAFANCVMRLSLKQDRDQPDHDTLVRRYRDRSMARRGDDRYPVCTAAMMDNELDISTGKWVGPNCQMAPD
ncbi:hypothetical protein [Flavisphingomonas formosensis]|uniref:hypothetical protein n=1 Tax=Flavisphingomonas formosensis TaxID=861534 RepID=UPI0012F9EF7C|nr:hypothetical protein [Sphingomonas formosensis]